MVTWFSNPPQSSKAPRPQYNWQTEPKECDHRQPPEGGACGAVFTALQRHASPLGSSGVAAFRSQRSPNGCASFARRPPKVASAFLSDVLQNRQTRGTPPKQTSHPSARAEQGTAAQRQSSLEAEGLPFRLGQVDRGWDQYSARGCSLFHLGPANEHG